MLSNEELEIQNGTGGMSNNELLKKGSLGIISLNLDALTIDPYLSIDRKIKMDTHNHVRMYNWSLLDAAAPKKTMTLTFTNESKADLTFNLNINGPFEIVKTKTNSGAVHPLSGKNDGGSASDGTLAKTGNETTIKSKNKIVKQKVETMFCLQPLKIVEVHVKFLAPPVNDTSEWPMTILNERKGEVITYFANGDQ